ncbi:protein RCC2 isoform X1 [Vidua chalybeata]|uniref:protein RCC2 isoform X1 n=1 Tax=Vidua chalybeata TaxID=81927 RepID=UPI0023A8BF19|nr:protein RCC2 isoform X1 [Vidua chalybeata]
MATTVGPPHPRAPVSPISPHPVSPISLTPCAPQPHVPSPLSPHVLSHPLCTPPTAAPSLSPFPSLSPPHPTSSISPHPISPHCVPSPHLPSLSPLTPHPPFPLTPSPLTVSPHPISPHPISPHCPPSPHIPHFPSPHLPSLCPFTPFSLTPSPLTVSPHPISPISPHPISPHCVPPHPTSPISPHPISPHCVPSPYFPSPHFPSLCPLTPFSLTPFPLTVSPPHAVSPSPLTACPGVCGCVWVSVCVSLSVRRLTRPRSHAPQEGGGAALGRCGPGPSGRRPAAAGPSGRRAAAAPAQRRQQRRQQRGGGAPGAAAAGRQPRGPQARQARRGGGGGGGGARRPRGPRAERGDLRARAQQGAHQARGLQEPGAAPDLRCHQLGPDRPQGGAQAAGGVPEPGPEPVGAAPLRQPGRAARALGGVGALRRAQPAHHGRGPPLELGAEREGAAGPRRHEARGGAAADRGAGQRGHRGGRLRPEPHPGTDRERLRVRFWGEQAGPAGAGEPDGRRAQPHPDPVQWAADLQAGLRGRVQHGHGLQGEPVFLRVPRVRPAGTQFRREVHRAGAAHRVRLRAAAAARGALRGAHQGRAGAARAQRRGQGRGLRGQPHAGAGFPEARLLLGLWGLRAPGPRGAEGRDGSQAGEALRLPGARRRPDLRGIHLLLRRQRDRWIVLLGRHQHLPGIHHVPQGRAGPVRVEDPQPGLREELRHRGGRREHHQLGALAHLRGAGIWGPQTQIVHGGAGGENPGRDLHRAGGHGLFPLAGDRPGRVGGGAGEAAEAPGVQPPHPLRGPHPNPDPDPASPSRPPCSLPVPAFPALGGSFPPPFPAFGIPDRSRASRHVPPRLL